MDQHVCPVWVGYLLLNPFRKLLESPEKTLAPYVSKGMTVLEPGCAMGYFTLPLARMVGSGGRVVAIDIQDKMLAKVKKRAMKAGLSAQVDTRKGKGESLGVEDMKGTVDFAAALHVVHEMPNQELFFKEVFEALRPGGKMLMIEPKGHVKEKDFELSLELAKWAGFKIPQGADQSGRRKALLEKPLASQEPAAN